MCSGPCVKKRWIPTIRHQQSCVVRWDTGSSSHLPIAIANMRTPLLVSFIKVHINGVHSCLHDEFRRLRIRGAWHDDVPRKLDGHTSGSQPASAPNFMSSVICETKRASAGECSLLVRCLTVVAISNPVRACGSANGSSSRERFGRLDVRHDTKRDLQNGLKHMRDRSSRQKVVGCDQFAVLEQ